MISASLSSKTTIGHKSIFLSSLFDSTVIGKWIIYFLIIMGFPRSVALSHASFPKIVHSWALTLLYCLCVHTANKNTFITSAQWIYNWEGKFSEGEKNDYIWKTKVCISVCVCVCVYAWKKVKLLVTQSCLTLCDPKNCSPSGPSVHGILQARILAWVASPFSRGSSWSRDWTCVSSIEAWFFIIWAIRKAQIYVHTHVCMPAQSLQSCPTLCNFMDHGPPGSSVHGILQARTLEWVVISFSSNKVWSEWREWSDVAQSCLTLCDPMDCSLPGSSIHGIFQARVLKWVVISFSNIYVYIWYK